VRLLSSCVLLRLNNHKTMNTQLSISPDASFIVFYAGVEVSLYVMSMLCRGTEGLLLFACADSVLFSRSREYRIPKVGILRKAVARLVWLFPLQTHTPCSFFGP